MVGFIPPIVGLMAIIIGAMVLTPYLMVPILGFLGFAATGPVAGTFAAWIQSWIGIVAAGGLFAMAQATAMGVGFIPLITGFVAGIIGATVLIPRLVVSVLRAVGFSAAGPVSGTFATRIQSGMEPFAAGGLFSGAQAIAMKAAFIPLAVGVGAGIIGATVLTPIFMPPVLGVVGFSAAGPVAGTLAAGIQSGIGNVAAGSLFATAQGAAMGAGTPVVAQVIGGVVTGIMGITAAILG